MKDFMGRSDRGRSDSSRGSVRGTSATVRFPGKICPPWKNPVKRPGPPPNRNVGYPSGVPRLSLALLPPLLAAGLVAGCGSGASGGGGGFSARGAERKGPPVLHLAMTIPPTTLDPAKVQDVETPVVLSHVFETLVQYDENSKIAPGLASSWTVSPDGTVYTFKLREAKFSNGKAFTSKDVRLSFDRTLSPSLASPVATTYLGDIKNAKFVASGKADILVNLAVATPDPRTVVITLEKPFG
ncbi:hypothetical protein EON77_11585, partial [bacterium]